jgi:hypothetical protein
LDYAEYGRLPQEYSALSQDSFLVPLKKLIDEDKDVPKPAATLFEVIPALLKKPQNTSSKFYLNPYDLSDWLPNAFMTYRRYSGESQT